MANKIETAEAKVRVDSSQAVKSVKDLQKNVRQLRSDWRKAEFGTKEYVQASKKLKAANTELAKHNASLRQTNRTWETIKASMIGTLSGNLAAVGVQTISGYAREAVNYMATISDAEADVIKTTGLTQEKMELLNKELSKIDTRTGRIQLLSLAKEAGRLGNSSVSDIARFVQEADKINVALGEDLGEEAVTQIAKISEVFNEGRLNIASAINEIGQSGPAFEKTQADYLTRTAAQAKAVGIYASEVLGYSAVLDEAGLKAEMGATALGGYFIAFERDMDKFAKVAGMSKEELKALQKQFGTNEALLTFLKNLKDVSTSSDDFINRLKAVGISGEKETAVFLTIAQNIEKVREKQALANKAMQEGTSITDEFNKRNTNLAASLEKLQKRLTAMWVNSPIYKGLEGFVNLMVDATKVPLSEKMEKNRIAFNALKIELFDTNTPLNRQKEIIQEMQNMYPELLKNLDFQKLGNKNLAVELEKVNDQLLNQIILEKEKEKIDKQQSKQKSAGENVAESLSKMRELTSNAVRETKVPLTMGLTQLEQAEKQLKAMRKNYSYTENEVELERAIYQYKKFTKQFSEETEKFNIKSKEFQQLKKELFGDEGTEKSKDKHTVQGFSPFHNPAIIKNDTKADTKTPEGAYNPDADKDQKKYEQRLKLQQDFLNLLNEQEREQYLHTLSQHEQEIEAINDKYDKQREKAIETFTDINQQKQVLEKIGDLQTTEVFVKNQERRDKINTDYWDKAFAKASEDVEKRNELQKQITAAIAEATQDRTAIEINETEKRFDELIDLATQFGIDTVALEAAKQAAIDKLKQDAHQADLDRIDEEQAKRNQIFQQQVEEISNYATIAMDIGKSLADYNTAYAQYELDEFKKSIDEKINKLDEQKESGIINQKEYEAQKEALQKQYAKKEADFKREQFVKQQQADIIQSLINTALAVSRALPNIPLSIAAGALGAIQTGVIASKQIPQFFGGGNIEPFSGDTPGGIYQGKLVTVHGGEYVVDNESMQNPAVFNFTRAIEAMKSSGSFFNGGYVSTPSATPSPVGKNATSTTDGNTLLIAAIDRNTAFLEKLYAEGVRATAMFGDETVRDITDRQTDFTNVNNAGDI